MSNSFLLYLALDHLNEFDLNLNLRAIHKNKLKKNYLCTVCRFPV